MKYICAVILASIFCFSAAAQEVELTVYNQNFALVKDKRSLDLQKGLNTISFNDVAKLIEPASVHFVSLTDPASCNILEQNYEYDLVNSDKLLSKYLDKPIKVITEDEHIHEGTLLSFDSNNLVLFTAEGLHMVTRPQNINQILFEKLPEGFITKPTLVWIIENSRAGKHLAEVSYLTQGVNWNCEYVAVLNIDDKTMDFDGWVSLDNRSGATYKDAKLKLIAAKVKRASEWQKVEYTKALMAENGGGPQFKEQAFFEYHMYTLQRKTTVKDNQTKQVSLLNARNVPVVKEFVFDPSKGKWQYRYYSGEETIKENVRVELEVVNSKKSNLGMPLPQGKVKVYKKDAEGSLQFIGEDAIEHTPKDEKVRLYIGDAFDIVGERTRTDFKQQHKVIYETYEISLRNHKEEDVEVVVSEKLGRYTNWKIEDASCKWDKKDASTIEFRVKVPRNGEAKTAYTVKYTW